MTFMDKLREWHESLSGDYVAEVEGQKFVEMMRKEHPVELNEWLTTHAHTFASQWFTNRDRQTRRKITQRAPQREFAEASQRFAEGAGSGVFDKYLAINDNDTRRPIGEMTGRDHKYVATSYANTGKRSLLLAAFHGAIAKKLGDRRTSDVFTEEQYLAMRDEVLSRNTAPALKVAA